MLAAMSSSPILAPAAAAACPGPVAVLSSSEHVLPSIQLPFVMPRGPRYRVPQMVFTKLMELGSPWRSFTHSMGSGIVSAGKLFPSLLAPTKNRSHAATTSGSGRLNDRGENGSEACRSIFSCLQVLYISSAWRREIYLRC
ncbi:unnamed protein product [Urochloa humidicola]